LRFHLQHARINQHRATATATIRACSKRAAFRRHGSIRKKQILRTTERHRTIGLIHGCNALPYHTLHTGSVRYIHAHGSQAAGLDLVRVYSPDTMLTRISLQPSLVIPHGLTEHLRTYHRPHHSTRQTFQPSYTEDKVLASYPLHRRRWKKQRMVRTATHLSFPFIIDIKVNCEVNMR
jgi:hypothetical protein